MSRQKGIEPGTSNVWIRSERDLNCKNNVNNLDCYVNNLNNLPE